MNKKDEKITIYRAEGSVIMGAPTIGNNTSLWCNAVIRVDEDAITVGERVNIQDCAVLHAGEGYPVRIGNDVTIGHGAIVHGCTIGDNTLIGMGAILLNGCKIGANSIVAAGTLVTQKTEFQDGVLVMGSPAKMVRKITEEEIQKNHESAVRYLENAKQKLKWSNP